ncbi:type I glyceraldehyde-3-phosphate dehydrogenase [Helicobacter mustelae]|uniref:Glyceraldehyde-3-phosphate dehydrogenase n=1 Tax=Helicobacter mustelae (strain ATCC 43772 / CCUG 25715 / CIP 103759 / LMG 18044 / NCTC 12198 / R85-136P) TaxID=679897 RepID=D3UHM2_HELM1|nr:type I glyceraldehyde-3-phosphate dehydrogenase [Helicobacter mustelae]CBG39994.1 glyceraldehyde 3-phosphate dehydrogenase [Helicobacter mustelae 12198]SQH71506.1 glyceraldehyde 3-phosphate dehydrogenase [Helicobacter mustelae]
MKKVAINGTGRIGICAARIIGRRMDMEIVAINSTADIDTLLHLIRHDSVHKGYDAHKIDEETLRIGNSKTVKILSNRDIAQLDFLDAEAVIECTGKFTALHKASAHLKGNIKKVIISAAAENTPTFVYGVNHTQYQGQDVISNASCTTNCLATIALVLHQNFGIESGLMTTVHSYTNDQNLLDVKHKDIRRARAAGMNMIPTSTGAAKAIGLVMPELNGKLNGTSIRVPTPDVSIVDLTANLSKAITKEVIHNAFEEAQNTYLKDLLFVDHEKCVSSDFIGSSYSAIFVPDQTLVLGNCVKILAWYDNEMGYSHRLVDMCAYMLD